MTADIAALIAEANAVVVNRRWGIDPEVKRLVNHLARALEASWPRAVRTVQELDALPEGTRAMDADRDLLVARERSVTMKQRNWAVIGDGGNMGSVYSGRIALPATVLWAPEATR